MSSIASLAIILLSRFDRNEVILMKFPLKITLQARDNTYYITV